MNGLLQWVVLFLLLAALLAWVIALMNDMLRKPVCEMLENKSIWVLDEDAALLEDYSSSCDANINKFLLIGWAVAAVIGIPLQMFVVKFTEAFCDELSAVLDRRKRYRLRCRSPPQKNKTRRRQREFVRKNSDISDQ